MAKCLNCNKEAVGRSKYCGDACKVAWNRNRKRNTEALIKNVTSQKHSYPRVTDQDFTKLMAQAGPGHVRVSKPGDADYEPQCETTKAFVEGRVEGQTYAELPEHVKRAVGEMSPDTYARRIPKRGLDIKCFADLPPDVQATINRISESNEEKQKRTAAAIKYQHLFPGSYHTTGLWLDDRSSIDG